MTTTTTTVNYYVRHCKTTKIHSQRYHSSYTSVIFSYLLEISSLLI